MTRAMAFFLCILCSICVCVCGVRIQKFKARRYIGYSIYRISDKPGPCTNGGPVGPPPPPNPNRYHFMYNGSLELTAPQHTAVGRKKCHPNFCRRITIFRVESTGMAFIACCGITCTIQSFFCEKRHRLLVVCRPNLRFNNTTDL
jgi:hypothetical protein